MARLEIQKSVKAIKAGSRAAEKIRFDDKELEIEMGVIEVEMFSTDVDDIEHPVAASFKELLEEVAEEYQCRLESFEVSHGIVSFSFDNDELEAEILKILDTK